MAPEATVTPAGGAADVEAPAPSQGADVEAVASTESEGASVFKKSKAQSRCFSTVSTSFAPSSSSLSLGSSNPDLEMQDVESQGPCDASDQGSNADVSMSPIAEAAEAKDAGDDGKEAARKVSRRRRACALTCLACVAGVLATLTTVLYPRDPQWEIQELIVDPLEVSNIIGAFMDPSYNKTVVFPTEAHISIDNRNFVGAVTSPGTMVAKFGSSVLAEVAVEPIELSGRAQGLAVAHSRSVITPEVSKELMKIVVPSYRLPLDVSGELPVRVPALFGLRLTALVNCKVDVNVLGLVQDPNKMVIGHQCSYSARF